MNLLASFPFQCLSLCRLEDSWTVVDKLAMCFSRNGNYCNGRKKSNFTDFVRFCPVHEVNNTSCETYINIASGGCAVGTEDYF